MRLSRLKFVIWFTLSIFTVFSLSKNIDRLSTILKQAFQSSNGPSTQLWQKRPTSIVKYCSVEQINDGQWIPRFLDALPYQYPRFRCNGNEGLMEIGNETKYQSYEWLPTNTSCRFDPWDADLFCNVTSRIYGKNLTSIAILGDSMSAEHYASFAKHLGVANVGSEHDVGFTKDCNNRNCIAMACHGTVRILYRRDFKLNQLRQAIEESGAPDIIILNRGSHYIHDDRLLKELNTTITALKAWQSVDPNERTLIWRTTVPGHPGCGQYHKPSNNRQEIEALVANLSWYNLTKHLEYHWWDFKHQNELILDLLQLHRLAFHVMDAYAINILRPDNHIFSKRDCLHNCLPGKVDVYNQLLLNILLSMEQNA